MRLITLCLMIMVCLHYNLQAQTESQLFKVVQNPEQVLDISDRIKFNALNEEKIRQKSLIDIMGLTSALSNKNTSVPLKGATRDLEQISLEPLDIDNFTYKGRFTKALGGIYLYRTNGFLYGNIHIDSLTYQIEPINKKYAVLLRRDYSQYEPCPLHENHEEKETTQRVPDKGKSEAQQSFQTDPVIDILVVFSNQAAAATPNMEGLALSAIQSSNDTFNNSNVGVTFNLVHHQQVAYNESGISQTDVDRLEGTSDGHMDNVHALRNQYGADVVVLIVENSDNCGRAAEIGAGSNQAFAVSVDNCSVGNYTFAHEVGHLVGALHADDPVTNPFIYGHGFRYAPAFWRTVMAIPEFIGDPVDRIPYWSNPDETYGGVAMGTANFRDNARVWEEQAPIVASFRTSPVLSAFIDGLSVFSPGSFGFWNADVSGGIPPYNYSWLRSYSSAFGPFSQVSTSSSYAQTVNQEMWLKLNVTDSNSNFDQDIMHIYTTGGGGGGGCSPSPCPQPKTEGLPNTFTLSQNYPNPFNPTTTIKYELSEQADVRLSVYNILGRRVATLVNTSQVAGFYEVSFDGQGLASGLYIARLEAVGNSGTQFVRELKMQMIK